MAPYPRAQLESNILDPVRTAASDCLTRARSADCPAHSCPPDCECIGLARCLWPCTRSLNERWTLISNHRLSFDYNRSLPDWMNSKNESEEWTSKMKRQAAYLDPDYVTASRWMAGRYRHLAKGTEEDRKTFQIRFDPQSGQGLVIVWILKNSNFWVLKQTEHTRVFWTRKPRTKIK